MDFVSKTERDEHGKSREIVYVSRSKEYMLKTSFKLRIQDFFKVTIVDHKIDTLP